MNLYLCLPLIISLFAPIRTASPDATKNRKSQVSRQSKAKRTVKRRRGNIRRTNRRRHNQKYELKRRRKSGGTFIRRRNSRATNNTNKQVNKKYTNRQRRIPHVQQSTHPNKKKSKSSKGKRQSRSSVSLSPLQKEVLRYQMQILLSDPEIGPIYRQILRTKKKKR